MTVSKTYNNIVKEKCCLDGTGCMRERKTET